MLRWCPEKLALRVLLSLVGMPLWRIKHSLRDVQRYLKMLGLEGLPLLGVVLPFQDPSSYLDTPLSKTPLSVGMSS